MLIYKEVETLFDCDFDFSQIARNVIDEKENNMKSLRESLEAEREQKAKLEKVRHLVDLLWSCVIKLKVKIVTGPRNKMKISSLICNI